jgi:WD40 repeat protein
MSQDQPTRGDGPAPEAPTEGMAGSLLSPGQVLGERYQVREQLGSGGMGEVWHAFDLKLRVEVALKALREDLFRDERRLEMLRQEVRAAREVVSPNVCRIFDLIEVDGSELVSMEYVDGQTLLGVLQERGPLDLKEAQDIASQFLAGLEAIHRAGLVHRDVKPENIMLTRAGRVVVMDFGLARQEDSGAGTVAGTPAYMAPEQAAGLKSDARADVYSAGVVLAEMVSPEGIKSLESRQSIWEGVRSEPAKLPDSPWAPVLKKAVAKEPDQRYNSAHTLTRALEDVTLRVEGAEDLTPYPGLASFTEDDAEYFFGREAEVEQLWRRLEGAHLLAVVGPSGAGKTSFIAAGVVPKAPSTWAIVRCTPGNDAISSLARVMAREMAGDADAVEMVVGFDDPAVAVELLTRWRQRHGQALLVVDQFEELFTLNPREKQELFAELLARLALEADVRVVLSMRDDFLMQCKTLGSLVPIFESLTPLMPPVGAALRRALVQPAIKCGYRFEDDALIDEILAEVEGERGALPLLAFAMSRLWEKRDRDNGVLTRQAFGDIGGVGGALGRHAEATLDLIGAERVPIVREIFRNLVTAEGTRAVREWYELLSVFEQPQRQSAEEALRALVDARLLTTYELREEDREATRRVEIIHESLLANWPRLVRWQTQDADAAQLRDQLRHAARAWDERGRSDDLLWIGTAFREYQLWRERYPGGLSELEEAFARAMTMLAMRRRRRRRIAAAVGVAAMLVVLAVVTTLWRRSVLETRRAEAQKLLALGEVEIGSYPTAALAWATASLELADTSEGRRLALRALSLGPPVMVVSPAWEGERFRHFAFSPTGKWLASGTSGMVALRHRDGRPAVQVDIPDQRSPVRAAFPSDEILITARDSTHRWWSVEDPSEPLRTEEQRGWIRAVRGNGYFSYSSPKYPVPLPHGEREQYGIHWWPLKGSGGRFVGAMEDWFWIFDGINADGSWLVYPRGGSVFRRSLIDWSRPPVLVGQHDEVPEAGGRGWDQIIGLTLHPNEDRVATLDQQGEILVWSTHGGTAEPLERLSVPGIPLDIEYGPNGRWLAAQGEVAGSLCIWLVDLRAPQGTAPLELRKRFSGNVNHDQLVFHPDGDWLVGSDLAGAAGFWPLSHPQPWVFDHGGRVRDVAFTPDGAWLLSVSIEGEGRAYSGGQLRAWPLQGQNGGAHRVLAEQSDLGFYAARIAVDPTGRRVAVDSQHGYVYVADLAGGPTREFEYSQRIEEDYSNYTTAFSPSGRLLAAVPNQTRDPEASVQVWDLETGSSHEIGPVGSETTDLDFVDEHLLVWVGVDPAREVLEERMLDLDTGTAEIRSEGEPEDIRIVGPSGTLMLRFALRGLDDIESSLVDNRTGESRPITSHGDGFIAAAFDPSEEWLVTGGIVDGVVRIGPVTGEEPHLLYGHDGRIWGVAVSPDGRWIASAGDDQTVRMWPMPDLSKPPFHTLPHDELMAKLKTLTNLRAIRDDASSTGWTIEVGPFPGWETVPEW